MTLAGLGLAACGTGAPPSLGPVFRPSGGLGPAITSAMRYIRQTTAMPLLVPSRLSTDPSSPFLLSAEAVARTDSYEVGLFTCPVLEPLNSKAMRSGNCTDSKDIFGNFGGESFSTPAKANSTARSIELGGAPNCPKLGQVTLAPGVRATLTGQPAAVCSVTWSQDGYTILMIGSAMSNPSTVPNQQLWQVRATTLAHFLAAHPGKASGPRYSSVTLNGSGTTAAVVETVGSDLYSASSYQDETDAFIMIASMSPYGSTSGQ
jgi:hypothetical protein